MKHIKSLNLSHYLSRRLIITNLSIIFLSICSLQVFASTPINISSRNEIHSIAQQNTIKITGKVTDESGAPIPFAAVCFKGTTSGCVAAENGKYILEAPSEKGMVIEVSSLGYTTQTIEINGRTTIDIILESKVKELDEIVATGYQTISKERATGSFDKIKKGHLDKPSSNISERLVGSVAGVNSSVNADGSLKFEIRGQTSLASDAQPLVVIDGFPVIQSSGNSSSNDQHSGVDPFSTINPNDVESITILKDAAATSIWGAKAANGVIVITTKKSTTGKAKVEFSSFWKVSSMADLGYFNPKANSAQTIEYEKDRFKDAEANFPYYLPSHSINYATMGESQAITLMNEHRLGTISEKDMNDGLARLSQLNNKRQIENNLLQNPFTQQYNLSISGGKNQFSNYLSLLGESNKGNFKGNNKDKFLITFRNRTKISKWLDFDFNGTMKYMNQDRNGVLSSYSQITNLQPYDMLKDGNGVNRNLNSFYYYTPILNSKVPKDKFSYPDWSYNPIQELSERDFNTKEVSARIHIGLNFKLMKGLTFNTKVSYEKLLRTNKDIYNENSFTMRQMVNETSSWDYSTDNVTPNMPKGGGMSENRSDISYYNWRNQLNYNRVVNEKHVFNFIAGTEISNNIIDNSFYSDAIGYFHQSRLSVGRLLSEYNSNTKMWLGDPITRSGDRYQSIKLNDLGSFTSNTQRLWSMYGNFSYTFDNKYNFTASVRNDASNIVAANNKSRYAPFWSVGGSWQIANEHFMSDIDWVNRLTLRGTLGEGGNFNPNLAFMTLMNVDSKANIYTRETTAGIQTIGNPDLSWERTRTVNLGVDFSILNSKLNGSIDLYNKKGYDLVVNQTTPSVYGSKNQDLNNGEMYNRGIELKLGTSLPILKDKIRWSGNVNFAYNKNKITKLFKTSYIASFLASGSGSYAYSQGYDASTIWSYKYAGIENIGTASAPKLAPVVKGVGGKNYPLTTIAPGNDARKYMVPQGTYVAPYIVSLQNSFKIYDFNLSFILTGKFGNKFRRTGFNYNSLGASTINVNDMYSEVKNGDPNKIVPIPHNELQYYSYIRFTSFMSYLTESASLIRFQELNLTYNVPKRIISKLGLGSVQFYAQGNNLGTILFNKYNEDPEYPKGTIKPQATYTFGLKVNL